MHTYVCTYLYEIDVSNNIIYDLEQFCQNPSKSTYNQLVIEFHDNFNYLSNNFILKYGLLLELATKK